MYPVLSDLEIRISATEAEADLRSRQRLAAIARPGLGATIVNAVRQAIDPRRYAMSALSARERAAQRTQAIPVAPVIAALPTRPSTQAAELPIAA